MRCTPFPGSGSPSSQRVRFARAGIACAFILIGGLGAPPAYGQGVDLLRPLPQEVRRQLAGVRDTAIATPNETQQHLAVGGRTPGVQFIEWVRYSPEPGRVIERPKFSLSFRNDALTSTLRESGVDVRNCYAPIVRSRGHLRQSGGTSLQTSLTLSIGCAF